MRKFPISKPSEGPATNAGDRLRETTESGRSIALRLLLGTCLFSLAASGALAVPVVELQPLTQAGTTVTGITHARDGSGRLFIADQTGSVWVVVDGERLSKRFFNAVGLLQTPLNGERGLIGLAFHPEYATNGRFFVHYFADLEPGDDPERVSGYTVISEFAVSSANPNVADQQLVRHILRVQQPFENHNGGDMHFGPDGYLYVAIGDGGDANDPGGRAQDLGGLLGKILRIDIDRDDFPDYSDRNYGIPGTNPFVGEPDTRAEIWAYGLRNPFRFSFDRATGEMFIGDVGQDRREEIDHEPALSEGGRNYGWRDYEGTLCGHRADLFDENCALESEPPILEFEHQDGTDCSIIGGYRYRGSASPSLIGYYVFADTCVDRIRLAREDGSAGWQLDELPGIRGVTSFGEDELGELYLGTINGDVSRLVPEPSGALASSAALAALLWMRRARRRTKAESPGRAAHRGSLGS